MACISSFYLLRIPTLERTDGAAERDGLNERDGPILGEERTVGGGERNDGDEPPKLGVDRTVGGDDRNDGDEPPKLGVDRYADGGVGCDGAKLGVDRYADGGVGCDGAKLGVDRYASGGGVGVGRDGTKLGVDRYAWGGDTGCACAKLGGERNAGGDIGAPTDGLPGFAVIAGGATRPRDPSGSNVADAGPRFSGADTPAPSPNTGDGRR
jgi:hypothetical protein